MALRRCGEREVQEFGRGGRHPDGSDGPRHRPLAGTKPGPTKLGTRWTESHGPDVRQPRSHEVRLLAIICRSRRDRRPPRKCGAALRAWRTRGRAILIRAAALQQVDSVRSEAQHEASGSRRRRPGAMTQSQRHGAETATHGSVALMLPPTALVLGVCGSSPAGRSAARDVRGQDVRSGQAPMQARVRPVPPPTP